MEELDWGSVTPESANMETNVFAYVYNHDLGSSGKIDRTIRFILGRMNHYDLHLPQDTVHQITIDIRGQHVIDEVCDLITSQLKTRYKRPGSLIVKFVKQ